MAREWRDVFCRRSGGSRSTRRATREHGLRRVDRQPVRSGHAAGEIWLVRRAAARRTVVDAGIRENREMKCKNLTQSNRETEERRRIFQTALLCCSVSLLLCVESLLQGSLP